jgi:quaternary ammonium compound-resistance protein SugE
MKAWLFLLMSAALQVGWLESLQRTEGFRRLVPLVWYALFGAGSTYSLSRALEALPLSTAYAAWTGLSVVGAAVFDAAFKSAPLGPLRLISMSAIVAGTAGLHVAHGLR